MQKLVLITAIAMLAGQGCVARAPAGAVPSVTSNGPLASTSHDMRLTSPAFSQGQPIPSKYTCDGQNVSPPLVFSDVPAETKSLVLLMDDPDVPETAGVKVWDHWVVFNIPPSASNFEEAQIPPGTVGRGTRNVNKYTGPCPPDREHRYFFKLYALDALLELSDNATKADVERAMAGHVVRQAELMGTYVR